ncbi:MAG: MBL fold metallo-hydrolase [Marivivens sp.]|nr:MBL fold metallo-hydrolase [Marivivens sp.]
MRLTRRHFLWSAAATAAGPLLGLRAHAQAMIGDLQIDTLSDGNLVLPKSFALGTHTEAEVQPILEAHGLSAEQLTPDCNVTLLQAGDRKVLFDVGAGANFMPSAGKLIDALYDLDVYPEEITDVIFTHAHPDHLWGVLDDFDDLLLPEAQYRIGRVERDYWLDPATPDTISPERLSFVAGAIRYLGAIEDRLITFEDGDEVVPGVTARASFGHTPGHMSFEIESGGESLLVVGDAIGNHHLAFERPDWASASDHDAETGAATRVALLDALAASGKPIIGYHLPFPGIGRAERAGDAFRFVAA